VQYILRIVVVVVAILYYLLAPFQLISHFVFVALHIQFNLPFSSIQNGTEAQDDSADEDAFTYSSSIVRGMPYATMEYRNTRLNNDNKDHKVPSIATEIPLGKPPLVDGTTELKCHKHNNALTNMFHMNQPTTIVDSEMVLQFTESDFTWIVFVSRPVHVLCVTSTKQGANPFLLQFVDDVVDTSSFAGASSGDNQDFVVRVALMNDCTVGGNPMTCGRGSGHHDDTELAKILRKYADLYPGPNTDMDYTFKSEKHGEPAEAVEMEFDWNVQSMSGSSSNDDLLMYALPHHQDLMKSASDYYHESNTTTPFYVKSSKGDNVCRSTLLGRTCLVEGNTWSLYEDFESHNFTSFRAPRPPHHSALPALVAAYQDDLDYELPGFFQRGAGDTYFSGKMLAKLARILMIGEELSEICSFNSNEDAAAADDDSINGATPQECANLDIPSTQDTEFQDAVARLRSGVEIWINGTGATPFVYDALWGGLLSCGCDFDGKHHGGVCKNTFPECPGFEDPGLNFGNGTLLV
jgi:hypothetical protein